MEKFLSQFQEKGAIAGLLLWITKPIHGHRMAIVFSSGFCMLKALIALRQVEYISQP